MFPELLSDWEGTFLEEADMAFLNEQVNGKDAAYYTVQTKAKPMYIGTKTVLPLDFSGMWLLFRERSRCGGFKGPPL